MRSVNRGIAPGVYTQYRQARNDMASSIGWFCSYCEMSVRNMIEVEHIHPVANGGNELDWNNFLLSCKYCNTVKSDNNLSRNGYYWPDIDNTPLAFTYSEKDIIQPNNTLQPAEITIATATINLTGLNRQPHSGNEPTDADSRWIARIEAFGVINESHKDWLLNPTPEFARQIARTAIGHGFYSFWILKFQAIPLVLNEINIAFTGTYIPILNGDGTRVLRPQGTF